MVAVESRFDPAVSAVIVVDVQNDFCDPRGALALAGCDTAGAVAMAPALDEFLAMARALGITVIFIQTTHDEQTDSAAWLHRTDGQSPAPPASTCRTGTWGAEFYGTFPEAGDDLVIKHRCSAFAGTDLDATLESKGVRSLFFTGVATEVCVESSLREGLSRDYQVTLVSDCCASYQQASHAHTITNVRRHFGVVADSAQISAKWHAQERATSAEPVSRE